MRLKPGRVPREYAHLGENAQAFNPKGKTRAEKSPRGLRGLFNDLGVVNK